MELRELFLVAAQYRVWSHVQPFIKVGLDTLVCWLLSMVR